MKHHITTEYFISETADYLTLSGYLFIQSILFKFLDRLDK